MYTAADLPWIVPQAVLMQDLTPAPGDVLIDSAANRWTVLETQFWALQQTWKLTTRNLALHYVLRDKIDIERATIGRDTAGVTVKQFPPNGGQAIYAELPARVQLLSEDIVDERGLRGFRGTHAVVVDRQVDVSNEDRIKWVDNGTTRYLDIVGYHDAQLIDSLPVIDAQLRP